MILQALAEYYYRVSQNEGEDIAPIGWERKEIPFIFVLDEQGNLLNIEDTRESEKNKKRAKSFLVPQGVKKTSGINANFLWDVVGYVIGILNLDEMDKDAAAKKRTRLPKEHQAFVEEVERKLPDTARKRALLRFLSNLDVARLSSYPCWEEMILTNPNVSFRFAADHQLYCQTEEVKQTIDREQQKQGDSQRLCLVTGNYTSISNLHTAIKGVQGAQSSGANIVSFNLKSFESYGKHQGDNAPIGKEAMFAYTTALNILLAKNSTQKMQVGDATTIFWSKKKTRFEEDFLLFFSEPPKDDPHANTRSIKTLLNAPNTGEFYKDYGDESFYVLGLSPNAARISIRFWFQGTVAGFADKIREYFKDLEIIKTPGEPEFYSLWRLLVDIAVQGKSENIPPNISADVMHAILMGTPFPQTLFQLTLRRIKSDSDSRANSRRAALLKATLNRNLRMKSNQKNKELAMALDIEQPSVGYQLGRLFATLEKIQHEANPGLNATIAERYYGSACSTPVAVFGTLMRLMRHHLAKIENPGRKIYFEQLLGEIMGRIDGFPPHLNLDEQGRFAVGYYHQQRAFYRPKGSDGTEK
jgi:CRISPR-associated protein Csd1